MIVKMKKVTLLVSARRTNIAVGALRKLGVMHIKHMRIPHADYITAIEHKLSRLDKALAIVEGLGAKEKEAKTKKATPSAIVSKERQFREPTGPWKIVSRSAKEITALGNKKQQLIDRLEELKKNEVWFKEWGNISQGLLENLKQNGIFIKLHVCSSNFLKTIAQDKLVYVIHRKAGIVYIAHISRSEDDSVGLPQIEVPHENLHSLHRKINTINANLADIDKRLIELSVHKGCFLYYKKKFLKKLEFCKVRFGMDYQEGIACLRGFCPAESVFQISKVASQEGWATIFEEPDIPDEVPILIRNPKWIEIIRPIFRFMGTLPGYKEYDISFWFLLFFSLFFAMLIGDGGYGLVLLAITFFVRKKIKSAQKELFFLMYVLSGATIIWGAITGTWFGFERIAQLPILNSLVIDEINSFVSANQLYMIYLCFVIGAVHLTIAHGILTFRFINSLVALAQIGWICIIWTAFFVAGNLLLNRPFPDFTVILGILGIALVVLFSHPQKNILKGMAISLADLPLKTISSFSDIVSYLRLFAVGYATVAVATTFNNMAFEAGFNNILTALIAAVILFLGHSLNILLGLMAVVVHGIRLNMLEFSGHLNMQWSGREYKPFKQ